MNLHATVLVQIYEENAIGDKNQIVGVVNEFKRRNMDVEVVEYPCNKTTNISSIINAIKKIQSKSNKKCVVTGVGTTAFSVFHALSNERTQNIRTLAMGHQWTDAYTKLLGIVTWIAVPDYALPEFFANKSSTIVLKTNGVSHAITPESLRAENELHKGQFQLKTSDRVVILGGDAPNEKGVQQRFTEQDAMQLAKAILLQAEGGDFYITNGPRTGKFDENLSEIKEMHRDDRIDSVTAAFVDTLKKSGVSQQRIKLFDFKFNQKSMYIPLLAAAYVHKVPVWVPGESSSMVCEVISTIIPQNVIVYDNNAMNKTHIEHIKSVYKQGRAKHYTGGIFYNVLSDKTITALPDTRVQIVDVIFELKKTYLRDLYDRIVIWIQGLWA